MFLTDFDEAREISPLTENFEPDHVLFRKLNRNKVNGCLANEIIRNGQSKPVAISCNCGKKHPIVGGKIVYLISLSQEIISRLRNEEKTTYSMLIADME